MRPNILENSSALTCHTCHTLSTSYVAGCDPTCHTCIYDLPHNLQQSVAGRCRSLQVKNVLQHIYVRYSLWQVAGVLVEKFSKRRVL